MMQPLGFTPSTQVLTITDSTSADTLIVTVTNQSGGPLTLRGGAPVAESSVTTASPSTFYLGGLALTGNELQNLKVTAPGWQAAFFPGTFANWGISPIDGQTLQDQDTVTITIANIAVVGPPRPTQLNIDYRNFDTVKKGTGQITLQIQNAPVGPKEASLTCQFRDGDAVYTTANAASPVANTLFFTISNNWPTAPLVSDDQKWGPDPPVFNISFVYAPAPGYGALTTVDFGRTMHVEAVSADKDNWTIQPNPQSDSPYWMLQPKPANHQVLGVGAQANVELAITELQSPLPVGSEPDVTLMYVQYANIPGCNDGFVTVPITKLAGPVITSFYANPASVPFGATAGPFTLYWTAENADVTFDAPQIGAAYYPSSGQGPLPTPVTLPAGQIVTMTAHLSRSAPVLAKATNPRAAAAVASADISVAQSLTILSLTRTSVGIGLNQLNLLLIAGGKAYQFQTSGGYGDPSVHKFAQVTLATSSVALFDFDSAIRQPGASDNGLLALAASPDGKTVYAFLETNASQDSTVHELVLVTMDTATNEMRGLSLGAIDAHAVYEMNSSVTSPDGSILVFATSIGGSQSAAPGGQISILPTAFIEHGQPRVKSISWPAGFLSQYPKILAVEAKGLTAYVAGVTNLAVIDLEFSTVVSNLPLPSPYVSYTTPCIVADRTRVFVHAEVSNDDPSTLLVVDIDPITCAMQISQQIPLGAGAGPMLLSADEATLYVWIGDDTLALVNTQTLSVQTVDCGPRNLPLMVAVAGDQNGVIYASSGGDFTTFTLDGFGPGSPRASRAARTGMTRAVARQPVGR